MVSDTPKFFDFIRVNIFDSIVNFYLVNLYNYMKTKEKKNHVDLFIPWMCCKYGKKIKGHKHSKYLLIWSGDFKDELEDELVLSGGV